MSLTVHKAGLLTTVQDLGRKGYRQAGVSVGGAMDEIAMRTANLLVGNRGDVPVLEITGLGPMLEFHEDALIAVCGGDLSPFVQTDPLPMWRPVFIKKAGRLRFGAAASGFRSYLAVAGGFAVPRVMGSASTDLRAGIGGFAGRALRVGDRLAWKSPESLLPPIAAALKRMSSGERDWISTGWSVSAYSELAYMHQPFVHAMKGLEYDWFSQASAGRLFTESFVIESESDRMGLRLSGPKLEMADKKEMLSEAASFGTIQVPPQGNPIVLMADGPPTGGYPRIAQVATADLPVLAQMGPGERIAFREITVEEARLRYIRRQSAFRRLMAAIRQQWLEGGAFRP